MRLVPFLARHVPVNRRLNPMLMIFVTLSLLLVACEQGDSEQTSLTPDTMTQRAGLSVGEVSVCVSVGRPEHMV